MIITNHVLAGVIIGSEAKTELEGFSTGVLSHFVLDTIPHWGNFKTERGMLMVAVPDGLIGLTISSWAIRKAWKKSGKKGAKIMAASIFGACLPDTNKPWKFFTGRPNFFPEKVEQGFSVIQTEHRRAGVLTEAAAASIMGTIAKNQMKH